MLQSQLSSDCWFLEPVIYLQSTSSGHSFIGIQCGAQLLPKELANSLFDSRDSGSTTHYLHCIYVFFFQL